MLVSIVLKRYQLIYLQVRAAMLYPAPVRVEIDVPKRLCSAKPAKDEGLSVRVDHIHELGVWSVQTCSRILELKQRTGWVETWNRSSQCIVHFSSIVLGKWGMFSVKMRVPVILLIFRSSEPANPATCAPKLNPIKCTSSNRRSMCSAKPEKIIRI